MMILHTFLPLLLTFTLSAPPAQARQVQSAQAQTARSERAVRSVNKEQARREKDLRRLVAHDAHQRLKELHRNGWHAAAGGDDLLVQMTKYCYRQHLSHAAALPAYYTASACAVSGCPASARAQAIQHCRAHIIERLHHDVTTLGLAAIAASHLDDRTARAQAAALRELNDVTLLHAALPGGDTDVLLHAEHLLGPTEPVLHAERRTNQGTEALIAITCPTRSTFGAILDAAYFARLRDINPEAASTIHSAYIKK